MNKQMSTFRLTPTAKQIIETLAKNQGISQAAVIEMAVRRVAKQEGLEVTTQSEEEGEDGIKG